MKAITENAWLLPMGFANAVLLRHEGELTLVDSGFPGKADLVFKALATLGHAPGDLKHLVLTHAHLDHLGSAAEVVRRAPGAQTWMHRTDVPIAERGGPFRPMSPAPGLMAGLLYRMVWRPNARVEGVRIDHAVEDGEVLPVAGGLRVVHTPGHCAGQMSLLWHGTRLLIAGDVATNMFGLSDPIGFEAAA